MTLLTLLKPKTDRAIDPAEAIARRLGMPQIAPYYVHELRTNPPGPDGGDYLVQLVNKDTGLVASRPTRTLPKPSANSQNGSPTTCGDGGSYVLSPVADRPPRSR